MKKTDTNVYAKDLTNYLATVKRLNIRKNNIKEVRDGIKLSSKKLGVSMEPTIEDVMNCLGEYDTVRLEMIERIENSGLLDNPVILKEIKKAGYKDSEEFISTAKEELAGEKDNGALRRVLMRGEQDRVQAKKSKNYLVEQDSDLFHPMGRIDESEIGKSINVSSVKELVKSFRR